MLPGKLNIVRQLQMRYGLLMLLSLCCYFMPQDTVAQSIILNGSFEDIDTLCEVTYGPASEKNGFAYQPISCIQPWGEYSNTQLLFNFNNYMKAGNAAVSVLLSKGEEAGIYSRSYVIAPLNKNLIKDSLYHVKFFCRLWYRARFTTSALHVAFSDSSLLYNDYYPLILNYNFKLPTYLSDTGWHLVSYIYRATGKEKIIVLGNLSSKKPKQKIYNRKNNIPEVHCLIDDLSVQPAFNNAKKQTSWKY